MKKQHHTKSSAHCDHGGSGSASVWGAGIAPAIDDWKMADYDRRQEGFEEEPLGYQQYGHEPYEDVYDKEFDRKYGENWRAL